MSTPKYHETISVEVRRAFLGGTVKADIVISSEFLDEGVSVEKYVMDEIRKRRAMVAESWNDRFGCHPPGFDGDGRDAACACGDNQ